MSQSYPLGGTSRLITADRTAAWRSILPASRSVFGSVEFCSIVQRHQGQPGCLYVYTNNETQIAYPFFLRGIGALPYVAQASRGADTRTPEFTGPIPLAPPGGSAAAFRAAFGQVCADLGIIAEFAHLNPWEDSHALLDARGLRRDRQIIYLDLSLPVERMWDECFTHACRKNIRRAERESVRVFEATSQADVAEFHRIYLGTMDRNQAASHYYFPQDYFTELMESLPDNCLMLLAEYQGQVIAGTLYLHDNQNIYSYLGGQDQAFQQVRPTNAVVYEAIRWGQARGKKRLVLGGGYRPDDGIFRFKASFSPLRADFYVYRSIHLPQEYQNLCRAWERYHAQPLADSGYFPLYRAAPQAVPAVEHELAAINTEQ